MRLNRQQARRSVSAQARPWVAAGVLALVVLAPLLGQLSGTADQQPPGAALHSAAVASWFERGMISS